MSIILGMFRGFKFMFLACFIYVFNTSSAQTTHYLSFTPRSINPSFWLCDPLKTVSASFNPYPAIGYGFIKRDFKFFANVWGEFPYFGTEINLTDTTFLGTFILREGYRFLVEAGVTRSVPVKRWLRVDLGAMGRMTVATYNVVYIRDSDGSEFFRGHHAVVYYGLPLITGVTMYPIRRVPIGLSIDLLWHLIYGYSYEDVLKVGKCEKVFRSYLPEVRFSISFAFLQTGEKNR